MSQLEFNEEIAKQLEGMYRIADAVRRRSLARAALGAKPGERILDLGCGPGFFGVELVEEVGEGGSVVCLDNSADMLAAARRRCQDNPNIELAEADATSLPVEEGEFDRAICVQVLEYVDDYSAALAELHRVLRPEGRVVIWDVDWATVSWHSEDQERMERVLKAWDEHLAYPSLPRHLAPALRAAGFEQVEMEAHPFATAGFDPESYGALAMRLIGGFAAGRAGVSEQDAAEWLAEQEELAERDDFYFACTQFCFTGVRAEA